MERKERIEFLRKRMDVLRVKRIRLLALLAMDDLEESARKTFLKELDATLDKLHQLSIDLSDLE